MKRRKYAILLLVVCLMAVCLSACGPSSNSNQEETSSSVETENPGILQIQNLEEIILDESPKLPYAIKMYEESTDAFNNPVVINLQEDELKDKEIYFSFTSKKVTIDCVYGGIIIETNDYLSGVDEPYIKEVGEIQTFTLFIENVEEVSTVVYDIGMEDSSEHYYHYYVAFRIIPAPTTATTTTTK